MITHRPTLHRYLAALALVLVTVPAAAQQAQAYRPVTAKDIVAGLMEGGLATWIEEPQRTIISQSMVTFYIFGVADSTKGKRWCPAPGFDVEALSEVVLNYLFDLPEARQSENAATIITEALSKAHPCRRR